MTAWLSGRQFIVTVYGSELLAPHGFAYRATVRGVLDKASAITVTTPVARQAIMALDDSLDSKVHCFHTGLDFDRLNKVDGVTCQDASGVISLLSLRNCAPQYRIMELLKALRGIRADCPEFKIVVIFGNGDLKYFLDLQKEFSEEWIEFADGQISYDKFLQMIKASDICLNFPVSDQLSASVLEALYFDKRIVTSLMPAYEVLFDDGATYKGWYAASDEVALPTVLGAAIRSTAMEPPIAHGTGRDLVESEFGLDAGSRSLSTMLKGML